MRVTLLGSGSSTGTPAIGPDGWDAADRHNARNRRTRACLMVEQGATTVLFDTSPDLRAQLLAADKWDIDAVVYTHTHADHVHGIDELRSVNYHRGGPIDAFAGAAAAADLRRRFGYVFDQRDPRIAPDEAPQVDTWRPQLVLHEIDGPFTVGDVALIPFVQDHGRVESLGFRFGDVAYSTDVKDLSEEAFTVLDGVRIWFVDCLRETPHPTHTHLAQTLDWIARVRPQRAILTHLSIRMDYAAISAKVPPNVEVGYDGLTVDV